MEVNIHYLDNNQKELVIHYDYIDSLFGIALLMCCENKICYLGFLGETFKTKEEVLEVAKKSFNSLKNKNISVIFIKSDLITTQKDLFSNKTKDIFLIGTLFQISVWKALLKLKVGEVISYEELSKKVENIDKNKNYTRATSNAVANNKISLIVPCHRIIRKNGSINNYLWGVDIKKKILESEGTIF